mgnify:CR=1 FL=1
MIPHCFIKTYEYKIVMIDLNSRQMIIRHSYILNKFSLT